MTMKRLGMDIGASGCRLVLTDNDGTILFRQSLMHHSKVKETVLDILSGLDETETVMLSVCGTMSHLCGLPGEYTTGEIIALETGALKYYPQAESIIMIGAQNTLYAEKEKEKGWKIRRNSNCSSGTGSFFEEQAGRLGIRLEDISSLVKEAKTVPHIAGRCSVFSKTDMIHHMQEGTPVADLLLGICYSLARSYKANVLQNRTALRPVLLTGGVMKNSGVLKALRELFAFNETDTILDENSEYVTALGCAASASHQMTVLEFKEAILLAKPLRSDSGLAPLYSFRDPADAFEYKTAAFTPGKTWLGIDIGSTSVNLVLIDRQKEVVYCSYVRNMGQPMVTVKAEIEKLKACMPKDVIIEKIAVTGSGREKIGKEIGADLVINEISAQTEGAVLFHPETDTIFEIGGQDSKYMSLKNGKMTDFEMNKVCAAGTGAFLEEQIKKLGITMKEFLDLAMKSEHPCALGDRCTVFIESSITKALASGIPIEDVCAGLAYAIANNYLNRVINLKPIGSRIVIQGGIAYNEAVICAFRALTKKQIRVSPWFSVTGALGAASLCTNTAYLCFDKEKNRELNRKLNAEAEQAYLGNYRMPDGKKPVIGIPRVIFLHKMFPLFRTLFSSLGFDVLLSPLTTAEIVRASQKYSVTETCYPIKLINGHIAWLLEHNADYIFLPRLYTIRHKGSKARKDYSCMYMQTSPLLMEQTFHFEQRGVKLLMPELSLNFGKKYMINSLFSLAEEIGRAKIQMIPAVMKGMKALLTYSDRLETIAGDFLDTEEPVFVLVSRVYNIIDPVLNMGIEEELSRMGCRVIHLEHLQASVMHVHSEYENLCWPFGQHQLTGMEIIREHKNLYPVYITNHGCGPDTALQHYIEKAMEGREYLHLEVDEHSSRIGIITRLEAFLYSLNQSGAAQPVSKSDCRKDCGACEKKQPLWLLPDFGIYTDLLKRLVPEDAHCVTAEPLKQHHSFNYAFNKEYYSLLVTMEEILNTVQDGQPYHLLFPTDEGSEVFSQYGRLIQQELMRRDHPTVLSAPFIEDIPLRDDHCEFYLRMIMLELAAINGVNADIEGSEEQLMLRCKELAKDAAASLRAETRRKVMVIGEPLCICKEGVMSRMSILETSCRLMPMPLSEAFLFHWQDVDRKGAYRAQLKELTEIHDTIMAAMDEQTVFSSLTQLTKADQGKLDFCLGGMARYRLAKLLTMDKPATDGLLLVHSNEENAGIIVRTILEQYSSLTHLPLAYAELDFEHGLNSEDAAAFVHSL